MQKLFSDTRVLDSSCRFSYGLTEEIMMENAASSLECEIRSRFEEGSRILILCGSGNNGADGYALSRRIRLDYDTCLIQCGEPSAKLCILQRERAEKCGLTVRDISELNVGTLKTASAVVDCIFGSGFHGDFNGEDGEQIVSAISDINSSSCYKIACDVPTGLRSDGTIAEVAFAADLTVTMGALKLCLYSDMAKDYTGQIKVANLGVTRSLFENSNKDNLEAAYLLEEQDMHLPFRNRSLVNKGSFGNAWIACGEKSGAGLIAANACFKFGAGLVTLIRPERDFCQKIFSGNSMEFLMAESFTSVPDSLALGMGLGHDENVIKFYADYLIANPDIKCVLDADMMYSTETVKILEKRGKNCVLTPHPKEFSALLKICDLGEYSVEDCVINRPELIEKFCRKYKDVVLLVKGANPMTGIFTEEKGFKLYVNSFGKAALAKGGSGDVLSGMICSLLAQGYDTVCAALNANLAHAFASRKIKNDFTLTPSQLIEAFGEL